MLDPMKRVVIALVVVLVAVGAVLWKRKHDRDELFAQARDLTYRLCVDALDNRLSPRELANGALQCAEDAWRRFP